MKPTIGISVAIVIAIALVAGVVPMRAQDYPTRSITVIVPFPAGGASDVVARIISNQMSKILGQPFIIENVSGAGGTVGSWTRLTFGLSSVTSASGSKVLF